MTRRNQKGFVLVDVILGMMIIVLALLAIGGLFYQSSIANIFADNQTVAYNWAQDRMEQLKATTDWRSAAMDFDKQPDDSSYNSNPPRNGFKLTTSAHKAQLPTGTLPPTTKALNLDIGVINKHLLDVVVTVTWTEKGENKSVNLETLMESY